MKISANVLLHLHRHLQELFPSVSDYVSQFEDGTQWVVSPVAALQVGVGHPWQDVPPAVKQVKQVKTVWDSPEPDIWSRCCFQS